MSSSSISGSLQAGVGHTTRAGGLTAPVMGAEVLWSYALTEKVGVGWGGGGDMQFLEPDEIALAEFNFAGRASVGTLLFHSADDTYFLAPSVNLDAGGRVMNYKTGPLVRGSVALTNYFSLHASSSLKDSPVLTVQLEGGRNFIEYTAGNAAGSPSNFLLLTAGGAFAFPLGN